MCFGGSQNKQRLFLYTALTYRFFKRNRQCLLCGTKWVFKSDGYSFILKGLMQVVDGHEVSPTKSDIQLEAAPQRMYES